jgi:hypothetical protein
MSFKVFMDCTFKHIRLILKKLPDTAIVATYTQHTLIAGRNGWDLKLLSN